MAQLDRLLTHLASRGGKQLRLEPNQQPVMEALDGSVSPVLPNAVPAPLLEHLASEVMAAPSVSELAQRGETEFDYPLGDAVFHLHISRTGKGTHIRASASVASVEQAPKAAEMPRIELAAEPIPRSTAMPRNPWETEGETQILSVSPLADPAGAKSTQPLPQTPLPQTIALETPLVDSTHLPDLEIQPIPVIPLATQPAPPTPVQTSGQVPAGATLPQTALEPSSAARPPKAAPNPAPSPASEPKALPQPLLPTLPPEPEKPLSPAPKAEKMGQTGAQPALQAVAEPPVVAPTLSPVQAATPQMSRIQLAAQENGKHPLAEKLFLALIQKGGSDLHVSAFEPPMVRVHGDLIVLDGFEVLNADQILEMMQAVANPTAWMQFQERMDADFAYPFEAGGCRLRVNYFLDRKGPGWVCRVIPNELPDPDKLGLADPIKRLADLSKGLVLVTGPTGSGKSTTLAAILDIVNRTRNDHILTIEDPIEFVHPKKKCLVNQREVGTHTESFKSGLRAALREDPDIVLVGEMRDLETIAIALETAITGHLVFGTLHTNSAVGTIDRIVDQFPADRQQQIRVMLADALKASLSQTLLKRKGGGRIAAIESLFITPAISNLIREGKNFQITSAMQTGRAYGQRLMNDLLVEYIQKNLIEPMEAYMKCPDKESFMASLKRAGINWDPRGDERPMPM